MVATCLSLSTSVNVSAVESTTPTPLTFTAQEANSTITFKWVSGSDVDYSTNGGKSWQIYTEGSTITLKNIGDSISFRSVNIVTGSDEHFSMTGKIAASGDVTSLTNNVGGDASLSDCCYSNMFYGCTSLTTAPNLPSKFLSSSCYSNMFEGCINLIEAPVLSSIELYSCCYFQMFKDCTSLKNAPKLENKYLESMCYYQMFIGCTSLTVAPDLPATYLAYECYDGMFSGCTSLKVAPELNATKLVEECYAFMFQGCTSLTKVPNLPATEFDSPLPTGCYAGMFSGCTGLNISATKDDSHQMGWSAVVTGIATTCSSDYYPMFYACGDNVCFSGDNPVSETTYYQYGMSIDKTTISAISDQTYTGSKLTPNITVKSGDYTLVKDADYTIEYKDNKDVGTATVTITGIGNNVGTKTATFDIVKADQNAPKEGIGYTLSYADSTLIADKGYEVSSSNSDLTPLTDDKITLGNTYYVRVKGDSNHNPSTWTAIKTENIKVDYPTDVTTEEKKQLILQ